MAARDKRLKKMRANPRDWRMDEVHSLCRSFDLEIGQASGGTTHWVVSHHSQDEQPVVVAAKPVNPFYIERLVSFVDKVQSWRAENEQADADQGLRHDSGAEG